MKTLFLLLPLLQPLLGAQTSLRLLSEQPLPAALVFTGDLQVLPDSSVALTASGGLYSPSHAGWILPPDSNHLLLSYRANTNVHTAIFSVYDRPTGATGIYCRFRSAGDTARVARLATVPGGGFRLLQQQGGMFVYGIAHDTFRLFEYSSDTLICIFTSNHYIPGELRVLNRNTLLLSFGDALLSLHRARGLESWGRLPEAVRSFVPAGEGRLLVSTATDLCLWYEGNLTILAPGVAGTLYLEHDRLYVLDTEKKSLKTFRVL